MKRVKILTLFLCAFFLLSASGCASENNGGKRYVAVIAKSVNSDFFRNMKNGADSAATEYNVDITFEGPENEEDYDAQNALIEKAVKNGADAIVLSAIDYKKSNGAVEIAVKSGVKVITADSGVSSELVSQFIGTDNFQAGMAAGRAAVDGFYENAEIRIGLVNYTETTDNGKKREEGFREAISAVSNVTVSAAVTVESNTESAKNGALALIEKDPKINVLVGFNEWMTLGIGEAIRELGAGERIKAVGFDTNVLSVSMLETGEMDALIVQNPFAMGYLGVKNAAAFISGEQSEEKEVYTAVTTVTKNNMFDDSIQKILFSFT